MGIKGHTDTNLRSAIDSGSTTALDAQKVRKTAYSTPASEAHFPEEMMLRAARIAWE